MLCLHNLPFAIINSSRRYVCVCVRFFHISNGVQLSVFVLLCIVLGVAAYSFFIRSIVSCDTETATAAVAVTVHFILVSTDLQAMVFAHIFLFAIETHLICLCVMYISKWLECFRCCIYFKRGHIHFLVLHRFFLPSGCPRSLVFSVVQQLPFSILFRVERFSPVFFSFRSRSLHLFLPSILKYTAQSIHLLTSRKMCTSVSFGICA